MCSRYAVSTRSIRRKCATFRVVTNMEMHYLYQVLPCSIEGTVQIGGQTFHWTVNPGEWMTTTYPDGIDKYLGTTDPAYLDTME